MAFVESRLITRFARELRRKRRQAADVVELGSGARVASVRWAQKLRKWDLGTSIRLDNLDQALSDYAAIAKAFDALHVGDGFRIQDPTDNRVEYAEGLLQAVYGLTDAGSGVLMGAAGLGYGMPVYQMMRRRTAGTKSQDWKLLKPVSGTTTARINGVAATGGTGSNQAAYDATKGTVTFGAQQSVAITTHTVGASHVLDLASAFSPNVSIGQRVYVSGVTGTAATTLNGLSHLVTNVAADIVTISTSTTGLTATGGTAALYVQAADVLDYQTDFDYPVGFVEDELDDLVKQRTSGGHYILQAPVIPVIELLRP
jgi:hypothetical protein